MKKYLLLASVAGCLLAHNAMAWDAVLYQDSPSATLQASVRVMQSYFAWIDNINFGTMTIAQEADDEDLLATFTNGVLSVEAEKVSFHEGGASGSISLSAGAIESTGLNFADTAIALKNSSNQTVMEVYDLARGSLRSDVAEDDVAYWINAKLRLKDKSKLLGNETYTGSTTVTLAF